MFENNVFNNLILGSSEKTLKLKDPYTSFRLVASENPCVNE